MKDFNGKVLFLDRADINTDEIIPAKYLTAINKDELKPHLLEDLKIDGFDPTVDINDKAIIITRSNFGCGSSREHAVWAFEVNGINLVVAPSFARIFRQNMYNCGMMAIELSDDDIDKIFESYLNKDTNIVTDFKKSVLVISSGDKTDEMKFDISGFDRDLVIDGGWIEYADKKY